MSAKNLDQHGRLRSKVVAFRVSPEEDQLIESQVALSGLTKQDYIISRLLKKDIVVKGNPKVYKALKSEMQKIYEELQKLYMGSAATPELYELIGVVADTLNGMKEENI